MIPYYDKTTAFFTIKVLFKTKEKPYSSTLLIIKNA